MRRSPNALQRGMHKPGPEYSKEWRTLGPSDIRMLGMSIRGTGVVFHQSGALRRAIFSSFRSLGTRSAISASMNERDIVIAQKSYRERSLNIKYRVAGAYLLPSSDPKFHRLATLLSTT